MIPSDLRCLVIRTTVNCALPPSPAAEHLSSRGASFGFILDIVLSDAGWDSWYAEHISSPQGHGRTSRLAVSKHDEDRGSYWRPRQDPVGLRGVSFRRSGEAATRDLKYQ
jgi:hypothetical protein